MEDGNYEDQYPGRAKHRLTGAPVCAMDLASSSAQATRYDRTSTGAPLLASLRQSTSSSRRPSLPFSSQSWPRSRFRLYGPLQGRTPRCTEIATSWTR
jgi:hypothetical protein